MRLCVTEEGGELKGEREKDGGGETAKLRICRLGDRARWRRGLVMYNTSQENMYRIQAWKNSIYPFCVRKKCLDWMTSGVPYWLVNLSLTLFL